MIKRALKALQALAWGMVYGHFLTLVFGVIQKCRHVDALEAEIDAMKAARDRSNALLANMRCAHCLKFPFLTFTKKDVNPDAT